MDLKLSCGITGSTNKRNQKRNETIVNNYSAQWRPKILAQYCESPAPTGEGGRVAREPQRELVPALDPPPAPDPAALAPSRPSVRASCLRRQPRRAAFDLLIGLLISHTPNEGVELGILVVRD